jgi:UDP-GlcNAc3NAcA epimerase
MGAIVTVVGARPQFIKAAAVSRRLRQRGIREILVHTGQHYDDNMSEVFFRELEIPSPDIRLGIGSDKHGRQTGSMLQAIEPVLEEVCPDWVVVYGDTNSTLAGALAAAKLNIPLAHVEAGLRSFNRRMPEEVNRILVDHASSLLLAPTEAAVSNLIREGLDRRRVELVGDVMYDCALYFAERSERASGILATLDLGRHEYWLATIHRAENTEDPTRMRAIVEGLARVASPQLPVVWPVHPRTRGALHRAGIELPSSSAFRIVDPVGYLDMVMLERSARAIVTDSGGVQKEAFFHRVPCITLRDETEWVELVELGWNRLVSPRNADEVEHGMRAALSSASGREPPADLYGGGHAVDRTVALLAGPMHS